MTEIDLEAAGSLFANAKKCKDYTFLVMLENAKYTKDALSKNPNLVTGKDLLFKSQAIPDKNEEASVELGPKSKQIKDKLSAAGGSGDAKGMIAVLTTSKSDNKDPKKRQADVKKVKLKGDSKSITLKGLVTSVTNSRWVTYHHSVCFVEMVVKGAIDKVTLEVLPKRQPVPMILGVWEPTAPGQTGCKRYIVGGVGQTHGRSANCKFGDHGNIWPLWSQGASRGKVDVKLPKGVENYVVGLYPRANGQFTFKVSAKGVKEQKIQFGFQGRHPHPGD